MESEVPVKNEITRKHSLLYTLWKLETVTELHQMFVPSLTTGQYIGTHSINNNLGYNSLLFSRVYMKTKEKTLQL